MKRLFYAVLVLLILYSLYLCTVAALHGELNFFNDVARDFLLLQELAIKKLVFIGPRSSTNNLFHGPLLTYIDFPAYFMGNGNPVVVVWFWILIGAICTVTSFFIAKKMFGVYPALVYALLLSTRMVPHVSNVFEPEAMFFVMPVFLFTAIRYSQTKKWKYLAAHLITVAVFIQLSIGVGLQFLILSSLLALFIIFKERLWKHLFSFLTIPLFTVNFILFDIRHNFMMTKALLGTGGGSKFFITIPQWIQNRIDNTVSLQLFDNPDTYRLLLFIIFFLSLFFTVLRIKSDKKQRPVYIIFLFYYFGYMVMSYFNKGILLFHYIYLLPPLTYLWLVSFLRGKAKILFTILIVIVYMVNVTAAKDFAKTFDSKTWEHIDSWKGLSQVALGVANMEKGKEFGYFVFSPDSFAYQPRYAMIYNFKALHAKAYEYEKRETTIVIAQPPPANDKYMDYKWWVRVPVGITNKPTKIITFPDGYTVLEYHLTPAEQKIPHDKAIELGIHFR